MEGIISTGILCAVLTVILVLGVRTYLRKLKTGCCGSEGDQVNRVRPADRDRTHYPYAKTVVIEGMHCQNCARRIENAFNTQEGFYAKVDLKKRCALVLTKHPTSPGELKQVIRSLGYRAVEVR
ncbi:MAG: cation transporter [Acutalibacter sp.]|jgi:copper chaperone